MPSRDQLAARGGLVKVRTIRLPGGRYRHIYVVRGAGKRGGHTLSGETKKRKG